MRTIDFLILGGGPTGLGAACRFHKEDCDWVLLEATDHWGGLASSFVDDNGFTWDLGGHVLFSHYPEFDRYMDSSLGKDGWFHHERESWIWLHNRFVPYPFQLNLHRLDEPDRIRCVEGLCKTAVSNANCTMQIANFRDWILSTFGEGIADLFLLPYNKKVWACPPEKMDYHWVGERVAVPDIDRVMRSIETGQDQVSWGPNHTFRFPRQGGTGAIWTALGRSLPSKNVQLSTPVSRIDFKSRKVITSDGREWFYRHLISTMPLNILLNVMEYRSDLVPQLRYSGVHIIGVGLEGRPPDHLQSKCWMYFPESNSPYYRVTVFSNYSRYHTPHPDKQWSLMAEVSESPFKSVQREWIIRQTIDAMVEDRLIPDPGLICSQTTRFVEQGYPTPFLGRDAINDPLLMNLESMGIYSRGRFGAWKYEVANMDHSFMQGYECADRLRAGAGRECEPTLFPVR